MKATPKHNGHTPDNRMTKRFKSPSVMNEEWWENPSLSASGL